jgi:hypothetical protein
VAGWHVLNHAKCLKPFLFLKMIVLLDLLISDNNSKKYTYKEIVLIIKKGVNSYMENWYKNTYVGCTITEYPKISVRACLPQHKNKPQSEELRPA